MTDTVVAPAARPAQVRRAGIALAGVLAAGVAAFALAPRHAEPSRAPSSASHPPADTVVLSAAQRASVATGVTTYGDVPRRLEVPGRVEFDANRVTPLFAQVSGRVLRLDVEVGSTVRAGQTVGLLDSVDVVGMHAEYQEAMAAARAARTSREQAALTSARAARLAAVEAIPLRELQEAQAAETRAAEDLRQADARVAAAHGRLQMAGLGDDDLDRVEAEDPPPSLTRQVPLVAPVTGTVTERHVGVGQLVQAGGDALFTIADLSTVWVTADVYEDQLAGIRPGAGVAIRIPAYPAETFTAHVDRIAATVDPETRTVAVRCVIANDEGRLKPGMFATIALQSGTIRHALLVPASAVVATGNRRTVFVETAPGTYRERSIEAGDGIGGSVVVTSGLQGSERIAVRGGVLLARQLAEATSR